MKNLNNNSQSFKTKMKAYGGGVAFMALMCVTSVSQAMNEENRSKPGIYKIKNLKINGKLTYTSKMVKTDDGHYSQVLRENISRGKSYKRNGKYRRDALWEISPAENGSYIIKNLGLGGGILTYAHKENGSYSGYYAHILKPGTYDREDYESSEGVFRKNVLWDISSAENGSYIIKNRGLKTGILAFSGADLSASGYSGQVLEERAGSYYNTQYYKRGGKYRKNMLWKIKKVEK